MENDGETCAEFPSAVFTVMVGFLGVIVACHEYFGWGPPLAQRIAQRQMELVEIVRPLVMQFVDQLKSQVLEVRLVVPTTLVNFWIDDISRFLEHSMRLSSS